MGSHEKYVGEREGEGNARKRDEGSGKERNMCTVKGGTRVECETMAGEEVVMKLILRVRERKKKNGRKREGGRGKEGE